MNLNTEAKSANEIKEHVSELIKFCLKKENSLKRNSNMDEYKKLCMDTYSDFHLNYPTLFFSIIENPSSFPLYRLDEMLSLKRKIEDGDVDEKRVSIHLGQKYYNEFVKDTVSHLDKKR